MNDVTQPARVWSPHQQHIFDFVQHGTGNAIVKAVAGSGKTTTIVEALARVRGTSLFLAFNKAIAEELKRRGVNARTFHSLTYNPVARHRKVKDANPDALRDTLRENVPAPTVAMYGSFVTRLVSLGKQVGIGCLVPDEPGIWHALVAHHDLDLEEEAGDMNYAVELARQLLEWSYRAPRMDFDDMLYIAVRDGLVLPKYDIVFVDEAQDTNAIQRAILRKVMHDDTRIIAVGDPAQAIYGFRGADSESMALIARDFDCTELPLTVTYRCPLAVVTQAQRWVADIQPAPGAPQGDVQAFDRIDARKFEPDDLVVCRTTKPLVSLAYHMLRARVGVRIMGREIGQVLKSLVNKMQARDLARLVEKLGTYTEREVEKAKARDNAAKAEAIQDKTDCVLCLVEGLPENERTIPSLLRTIDALFADVRGVTTLATIHKAKGLEARRVWWLNSAACPAKWARQEWQQQQERNLCYVAITRAKSSLYFIEDGSK